MDGSIDFNVGEPDEPLTCADYYRNEYTPEAYLAAYDPDLVEEVGWTPTLSLEVQPTGRVPSTVQSEAGPLDW